MEGAIALPSTLSLPPLPGLSLDYDASPFQSSSSSSLQSGRPSMNSAFDHDATLGFGVSSTGTNSGFSSSLPVAQSSRRHHRTEREEAELGRSRASVDSLASRSSTMTSELDSPFGYSSFSSPLMSSPLPSLSSLSDDFSSLSHRSPFPGSTLLPKGKNRSGLSSSRDSARRQPSSTSLEGSALGTGSPLGRSGLSHPSAFSSDFST